MRESLFSSITNKSTPSTTRTAINSTSTTSTTRKKHWLRYSCYVYYLYVSLALASNKNCVTQAFGISNIVPQPSGLSQKAILDLARKRYHGISSDSRGSTRSVGAPVSASYDPEQPMLGKVSVITGAAGGIGREIAQVIYSLGGTIIALDRNVQGLEELKQTLTATTQRNDNTNNEKENHQRIWTLPTNHEDLNSVSTSANTIKSNFQKIDLLVNNAGLAYDPVKSIPGQPNMKSTHGKDLAFTVNYLSHFLLTQKLLPNLSAASLSSSSSSTGRIVHVTSTYHWKVDGSEITPRQDGTVLAYEAEPENMSAKHVERSYGNTKLAQIWYSRSIQRLGNSRGHKLSSIGCSSVCACPTWAATGIGGEESRSFLEQMAFPVSGCGAGITSVINAMFRTDEELRHGDALDNGRCFVGNSRIMDYIKLTGTDFWMTSKFVTKQLGWRDTIVDIVGFVLLIGQRFTYDSFIIQETSPESYNDEEKRDSLFHWSYDEVEQWLD